jgi:hypothetical protein
MQLLYAAPLWWGARTGPVHVDERALSSICSEDLLCTNGRPLTTRNRPSSFLHFYLQQGPGEIISTSYQSPTFSFEFVPIPKPYSSPATYAHPCPPMLFKLRPCIQKLCNVHYPPTPSLGWIRQIKGRSLSLASAHSASWLAYSLHPRSLTPIWIWMQGCTKLMPTHAHL